MRMRELYAAIASARCASHAVYTVCITGYVVLLLTLAGVTGTTTAWYRALYTVLGGVLGLVVYAVWPTWESRHVPDLLVRSLRTPSAGPPMPRLRETALAIEASASEIAAEADMMIDSVNTMAALLARPSSLKRSA